MITFFHCRAAELTDVHVGGSTKLLFQVSCCHCSIQHKISKFLGPSVSLGLLRLELFFDFLALCGPKMHKSHSHYSPQDCADTWYLSQLVTISVGNFILTIQRSELHSQQSDYIRYLHISRIKSQHDPTNKIKLWLYGSLRRYLLSRLLSRWRLICSCANR